MRLVQRTYHNGVVRLTIREQRGIAHIFLTRNLVRSCTKGQLLLALQHALNTGFTRTAPRTCFTLVKLSRPQVPSSRPKPLFCDNVNNMSNMNTVQAMTWYQQWGGQCRKERCTRIHIMSEIEGRDNRLCSAEHTAQKEHKAG